MPTIEPKPVDAASYEPARPVSVFSLVTLFLAHARLVLLAIALGMLAGAASIATEETTFTATSRFIAQGAQNTGSRIAGIAAQFGLDVGTSGGSASPEFYATLVSTREILTEAARTPYWMFGETRSDTIRGTLAQLYDLESSDPDAAAVTRLKSQVSTRVDITTGIIELRTRAMAPELAVQINARLLELLNEFNLDRRMTQASDERRFLEARLADARRELDMAEADLTSFHARNRQAASPELRSALDRLQRRVELRQQVYTSLAQNYEGARLDEVRNTPVITVIERPEGSAETPNRRFLFKLILGAAVGLGIAIVMIFGRAYLQSRAQSNPAEIATMRASARAALHDLMRAITLRRARKSSY